MRCIPSPKKGETILAICKCGCGEKIIEKPHHKQRPVRFCPHHFTKTEEFREFRKTKRVKPPKGKAFSGLCGCGCGGKTKLAVQTAEKFGHSNGYPLQYIHGHNSKGKRAAFSAGWKGGRITTQKGHICVFRPDHHLAESSGYVREHRLVWEEANGRRLKTGQVVHHIDGNPGNNAPENLAAMSANEHSKLHNSSPERRRQISDRFKKMWAKRKASHVT